MEWNHKKVLVVGTGISGIGVILTYVCVFFMFPPSFDIQGRVAFFQHQQISSESPSSTFK